MKSSIKNQPVKTMVMAFLMLLITSQHFGQGSFSSSSAYAPIRRSEVLNEAYMNVVLDANTPKEVANVQEEVARYKVRSQISFSDDIKTDNFEVVFKTEHGSINAFYNASGDIEASYGRFRNILLPKALQQEIYSSYAGWIMTGNVYTSSYEENGFTTRYYKIYLEKDGVKKRIILVRNK